MNPKQKSYLTNSTPDTISAQKYPSRIQREKIPNTRKKSIEITKTKSAETPKSPESTKIRSTKPITKQNVLKPVTVLCDKSKARPKTPLREPWAEILTTKQSNGGMSSFSNFDPLRTVHFLAKELQFNLQNMLPDDSNVHQMIQDMQHALKRVPPEVSSAVHLRQAVEMYVKKTDSTKSLQDEIPEKLTKYDTLNKYCQTPPSFNEDDTELIKRIVEKNTIKLETSCKEMQKICDSLQNEKLSLENQLKDEKETVKYLKSQLKDSDFKVDEIIRNRVNKLQIENEQLQTKIQKLKVEVQTNSSSPEIYKLKAQKFKIEDDYNKVKNDLSLLEIEKEKYVTLLKIRDREIAEYREEMGRYRLEINDTLAKLQNEFADCFIPDEQKGTMGDATISTIESNEHSFKEVPAGDYSEITEKNKLKDVEHLEESDKDAFKETVQ